MGHFDPEDTWCTLNMRTTGGRKPLVGYDRAKLSGNS